eukprot:SAG31_NODE_43845_length_265_cov_0.813253_1_plen_66_part_01
MLVNDVILTSGITTATVGGQNKIIDGTADFIADGVSVGDIVGITIGGISYNLSITLVENGTTLVIS